CPQTSVWSSLLTRYGTIIVLGAALAACAGGGSAGAAMLPAGCVKAAGTVTCTYTTSGSAVQLAIPAGATDVSILVDGAPGGSAPTGNAGGKGAEASG